MNNNRNYHSRSYHRFFEDWAERRVHDESGKIHVERVYVGSYYRSALSKKQRILRRILYLLLYILAVSAFIMSGIRDVPVNHALLPSLVTAVCVFTLVLLTLPLGFCLFAPEEMIIRQYRSSSLNLIRMSRIAAISLTVAMVCSLLFLIFVDTRYVEDTLWCVLGDFAAACFTFILYLMEKRHHYIVIPPRATKPENSTVVQFESTEQLF